MKKIIIAGGTGFLGKLLEDHFEQLGDHVYVLTRKPKKDHHIYWDGKTLGQWVADLESCDVLINLSGRTVDCRYTEKNRDQIFHSRIDSTRIINKALAGLVTPPSVYLNSSSATIYEHSEIQKMTEATGVIGDDFSMNICKAWEQEFFATNIPNIRKVAIRTSIVLGAGGGAFPKMRMITKMGLGGIQGNGKQKVSWIHESDFCKAIEFIISKPELKGAINITAPNPGTNRELMQEMRKQFKMRFGFNQSKELLEFGAFIMRTETELLLKSRNVIPEILLDAGFNFQFNKLEDCIKDLAQN